MPEPQRLKSRGLGNGHYPGFNGLKLLCRTGLPLTKSRLLLLVSVRPPSSRCAYVVLLKVGAGPPPYLKVTKEDLEQLRILSDRLTNESR